MGANASTSVFDLNAWMKRKSTGSVMIEHVGGFTSEYIDSVLPAVEQGLNRFVDQENIRKKAFHIFVECIQNLYHHIESNPSLIEEYGDDKLGAIVLTTDGSSCRVTTGNFIPREKKAILENRIDRLNAMDASEIKQLYRDTINNQDFSSKGGAGIGMIDMARKTGNKLLYDFYDVKDNPGVVFFSFDVCIN
ncbi:MAG: SiaB family protein kinase [Bacteroidales bacterium]|nr:SiaB family protein kinase [Bacteroidales bacterium]